MYNWVAVGVVLISFVSFVLMRFLLEHILFMLLELEFKINA